MPAQRPGRLPLLWIGTALTATLGGLSGGLIALPARSQMMLDAVGASAIQGGLQTTAVPSYTGTLTTVQQRLHAVQSNYSPSNNFDDANASAAATPSAAGPGATPTGGGGDQGSIATYVNGYPVAVCSHGGLCLGQLRRALQQP